MCCLVAVMAFIGPRAGILVWWLMEPSRWQAAFPMWLWPLLGTLFLPWTTLAYVLVASGGLHGLDWVLLIIAVLADLSMYGGGGYSRQRRSR